MIATYFHVLNASVSMTDGKMIEQHIESAVKNIQSWISSAVASSDGPKTLELSLNLSVVLVLNNILYIRHITLLGPKVRFCIIVWQVNNCKSMLESWRSC